MCDLRTFVVIGDAADHDDVVPMQKSLHSEKYVEVFLALLRSVRQDARMTQQELALALGVERTLITKVETGVRRLDPVETFEWVRCLGVTFAAFAARLEDQILALDATNTAARRRPKRQ